MLSVEVPAAPRRRALTGKFGSTSGRQHLAHPSAWPLPHEHATAPRVARLRAFCRGARGQRQHVQPAAGRAGDARLRRPDTRPHLSVGRVGPRGSLVCTSWDTYRSFRTPGARPRNYFRNVRHLILAPVRGGSDPASLGPCFLKRTAVHTAAVAASSVQFEFFDDRGDGGTRQPRPGRRACAAAVERRRGSWPPSRHRTLRPVLWFGS